MNHHIAGDLLLIFLDGPMYICATASPPTVAVVILKVVSSGAARGGVARVGDTLTGSPSGWGDNGVATAARTFF